MPRVVCQIVQLGLLCLVLGSAITAQANPSDYPEHAQIKMAQDVKIEFITAEQVKQRLDAGETQVIIDVRDNDHFQKMHLPGAISIPLRTLESDGTSITQPLHRRSVNALQLMAVDHPHHVQITFGSLYQLP